MEQGAEGVEPRKDWKGSISLAISLIALAVSAISAYVTGTSTFVSRRPILVVDHVDLLQPIKANSSNYAAFTLKNAGSSPGLRVVIRGKSDLVRVDQRKAPDFDNYNEVQPKNVVSSGATFSQNILITSLSAQELREISDQAMLLYVHGSVQYEDMWNKSHWLKFCYKLDPLATQYYSCQEHNEIDN